MATRSHAISIIYYIQYMYITMHFVKLCKFKSLSTQHFVRGTALALLMQPALKKPNTSEVFISSVNLLF